jgi:hypothetical protein
MKSFLHTVIHAVEYNDVIRLMATSQNALTMHVHMLCHRPLLLLSPFWTLDPYAQEVHYMQHKQYCIQTLTQSHSYMHKVPITYLFTVGNLQLLQDLQHMQVSPLPHWA